MYISRMPPYTNNLAFLNQTLMHTLNMRGGLQELLAETVELSTVSPSIVFHGHSLES
jgi:hypothetical protein